VRKKTRRGLGLHRPKGYGQKVEESRARCWWVWAARERKEERGDDGPRSERPRDEEVLVLFIKSFSLLCIIIHHASYHSQDFIK
jgi:hypothetical protein